MAEEVLSDSLILFDGYDLSCNINQVVIEHGAEPLDRTALCHTTRVRRGGLLTSALSAQGFFEAANPDSALFSNIGAADKVISVVPTDADGERAFTMQSMIGEYSPIQGAVGDLAGFSLNVGASTGRLVRGTVMHNNTRTSSGDGTARQLGAVTSSQKLYAALHVIAASGSSPTLDIDIESDDNSGMTSATSRGSFAQATGIGSEWVEIDGAITDDYWRVSYTIGGSTPSFQFIVILGIH